MSKEFEKEIAQLNKLIEQSKDFVKTEESTKMSFVLPFFKALGYNYSDPREVVAEFTADINGKNMDKIDYVIMENGQPVILVECKHWSEKLESHVKQLFKYFVSTPAKFAILTNGIEYLFYTDLEERNKLDNKPFLKIDMLDLKAHAIKELAKFKKDSFSVGEILTTAEELKYTNSIINLFTDDYQDPTDDFVKYTLSKVYEGLKTQAVVEKFRPIIKNSFSLFVNELINDRLENAIEKGQPEQEIAATTDIAEEDDIVTVPTEEELQAFYIVKGILAEIADVNLIHYKDTTSYLAILFENKATKWICRIVLKRSSKVIIFPNEIHDEKISINSINDLYKHKEVLIKSCQRFL
ncbi:MAG: type I restriction endonuclease [Defluviitaleaceae bacterium]|nr:type I restriction endonuclease [Defluviitaleaceae bacterium]